MIIELKRNSKQLIRSLSVGVMCCGKSEPALRWRDAAGWMEWRLIGANVIDPAPADEQIEIITVAYIRH